MSLPSGFRYASTYAGIRKVRKDDLAVIVSETPASAAAVFTTNLVQAAPVRLARRHLKSSRGRVRAVLVNAGNANCATRNSDEAALACCRALARRLRVPVEQVIPASTGVIGVDLDPRLITGSIPALIDGLDDRGFDRVAKAIMTTDRTPKVAGGGVDFKDGTVRIAGMTKGSGMIHPHMATTLAFVMTDALISPAHLKPMLVAACERSYHRVSVDGDTSTNDMILLLAGGASGVKPNENERKVVQEVLSWVLEDLAEQIASDGEGAGKLILIRVSGAATDSDAQRIARSIANSPLVKTAIAGSDPNWGRILAAAGYSGAQFDPSQVDIFLQGTLVCSGGLAADFNERELKRALNENECRIRFMIRGRGAGQTLFRTCDLTHGYIDINASYRT